LSRGGFWSFALALKIRASGLYIFGQKILIFNDRIWVLDSILTTRH